MACCPKLQVGHGPSIKPGTQSFAHSRFFITVIFPATFIASSMERQLQLAPFFFHKASGISRLISFHSWWLSPPNSTWWQLDPLSLFGYRKVENQRLKWSWKRLISIFLPQIYFLIWIIWEPPILSYKICQIKFRPRWKLTWNNYCAWDIQLVQHRLHLFQLFSFKLDSIVWILLINWLWCNQFHKWHSIPDPLAVPLIRCCVTTSMVCPWSMVCSISILRKGSIVLDFAWDDFITQRWMIMPKDFKDYFRSFKIGIEIIPFSWIRIGEGFGLNWFTPFLRYLISVASPIRTASSRLENIFCSV